MLILIPSEDFLILGSMVGLDESLRNFYKYLEVKHIILHSFWFMHLTILENASLKFYLNIVIRFNECFHPCLSTCVSLYVPNWLLVLVRVG